MKRAAIAIIVTLLIGGCTGDAAAPRSRPAGTDVDVAAAGASRGPVATCPEGSNPDRPGPADQARPGKGGGPMTFDRRSGRIVLVETNYDPSSPEVETWTFDVCTNTWFRMEPAMEPPNEVRKLVYDEDADLTVAIGGTASGWTYDVETDTWSKGRAQVSIQAVQAAHDPVTGLIVVRDGWTGSMYSFDVGTGTWADVEQAGRMPPTIGGPMHGQVMAYDPTIDRLVLFVEGHRCCPTTWLFDLRSGTWTKTDAETPTIEFVMGDLVNGDEIVFDEAAGRIVVMSGEQRHIFDGSTLTWESLPSGLDRAFGVRLVYDAVNRRLVLNDPRVSSDGGWEQTRSVLAFEPFAGRWIELVPALER